MYNRRHSEFQRTRENGLPSLFLGVVQAQCSNDVSATCSYGV